MAWVHYIIIYILHGLGLLHVPEWDNTPSPWVIKEKKEKALKPGKPRPPGPEPVTMNYGGIPDPGKRQQTIDIIITEEKDGKGWNFQRYDGAGCTMDYSKWSNQDNEVLDFLKFSEHQREMYKLVRPDVLAGMKNREVGAKHGRTTRWADTYCAAVRAMCRLRDQDTENHSPTDEMGEWLEL